MDEKQMVQMQQYPGLPPQPDPYMQPGMQQPGMPGYGQQPGMTAYGQQPGMPGYGQPMQMGMPVQPGQQPPQQVAGMPPVMYNQQPGGIPGQPMVVQGQPVTSGGQQQQVMIVVDQSGGSVSGKGPYPNEQCCCCFEISCGVKTMGCLLIIGTIFNMYNFLRFLAIAEELPDQFQVYIWVGFVSSLTYCWPCWYYMQFFKDDNVETRNKVVKAQFILIFLSAWIYIWSAAGPFILIGEAPGQQNPTTSSSQSYGSSGQSIVTENYYGEQQNQDLKNAQAASAAGFIIGSIISLLINIAINYYYYMVAKRFAALHPGNEKYSLEGMKKLPC